LKLKAKQFLELLRKSFGKTFERILKKKEIRAGRGKLRGRKYKSNAGMLFVVGSDEKMRITGIDVVSVNELEIKDLAPNGEPGRIAIYSEKAIKEIGQRFGGQK
jgi:large subunit ribosomal protein L4e